MEWSIDACKYFVFNRLLVKKFTCAATQAPLRDILYWQVHDTNTSAPQQKSVTTTHLVIVYVYNTSSGQYIYTLRLTNVETHDILFPLCNFNFLIYCSNYKLIVSFLKNVNHFLEISGNLKTCLLSIDQIILAHFLSLYEKVRYFTNEVKKARARTAFRKIARWKSFLNL